VFYNANAQFQDSVAKCISLAYVPVKDVVEYAVLIEQEWDLFEEQMTEEAAEWMNYFLTPMLARPTPELAGVSHPSLPTSLGTNMLR
jgi:hypothetical protein